MLPSWIEYRCRFDAQAGFKRFLHDGGQGCCPGELAMKVGERAFLALGVGCVGGKHGNQGLALFGRHSGEGIGYHFQGIAEGWL